MRSRGMRRGEDEEEEKEEREEEEEDDGKEGEEEMGYEEEEEGGGRRGRPTSLQTAWGITVESTRDRWRFQAPPVCSATVSDV